MQGKAFRRQPNRERNGGQKSESLMQVVADLAVAEGREGEYKAGIYQFPIDYTKVLLSLSHSLSMWFCTGGLLPCQIHGQTTAGGPGRTGGRAPASQPQPY